MKQIMNFVEWFASKDSVNSNITPRQPINFYSKTIGVGRITSLQPIDTIDLSEIWRTFIS